MSVYTNNECLHSAKGAAADHAFSIILVLERSSEISHNSSPKLSKQTHLCKRYVIIPNDIASNPHTHVPYFLSSQMADTSGLSLW
jgi:hypothetical protein